MRSFHGIRGLELYWRDEFRILEFRDESSAAQLLAELRRDQSTVAALRAILAADPRHLELSRLGDDQVFAELARLLLRGELRAVVRRDFISVGPGASEQPPVAQAAVVVPRRTRETTAAPEPEASTFPPDHDAAAQAGTLRAAADTGVPFCEECALAAAAGKS